MGERSLVGVPTMGFHLAIGDSLLGGQGALVQTFEFDEDEAPELTYTYDTEDIDEYLGILQPGQYHVVVGNPPYITPQDKVLNARYRQGYISAAGKYALSAPFVELLFRLAILGGQGQGAGYIGQITSNSFMKREFGKKLIEHIFAGFDAGNPIDLTAVIDTSGAYIPGHGTPTVIIVGRRRRPVGDVVRAVLGVRGEPGQPADPAKGLVWTEIVENFDSINFDGQFVTVTNLQRGIFAEHPWSLAGGGAGALKEEIDLAASRMLAGFAEHLGITAVTGEDSLYMLGASGGASRLGVDNWKYLVEGDAVRDYAIGQSDQAIWPYEDNLEVTPFERLDSGSRRLFSAFRHAINRRRRFGTPMVDRGLAWWEWQELYRDKLESSRTITFAFVATHNHFVLDRGGKVFKQSAPVIKLPEGATEEQHLELLGVLNSSTACFWLKQVSHNKGSTVDTKGARQTQVPWEDFYEFTGTKLQQFPLPSTLPLERGRVLDALAQEVQGAAPRAVLEEWLTDPTRKLADVLNEAAAEWSRLRERLIFEQEELDWEVYQAYALTEGLLTYSGSTIDGLELGQRAFEVALARRVVDGIEETAWFERHNSTPITELPAAWPEDYTKLVRQRLELIEADRGIGLLERPEFKRRWATTSWNVQRDSVLQEAILDRLEDPALWRDTQGPVARSVAELADHLRGDTILKELAKALVGTAEPDLAAVIGGLAPDQAVPYLAAHRYKPSGVEKYRSWQSVWGLQRREDAGEKVTIPVPPKYGKGDFTKTTYWTARGKLDVPKERFISYPGVARESDPTPVLGWSGWSHRDQALALAREIPTQQALGADDDALVPLVAGLVELEPWLAQWHSEIEPEFGASPSAVVGGVVDQYLARMEKTRSQVTAWMPPPATRGRRKSR
ncbi:BREX-2 system adenine-specific DNA-methyltransferase PglX [Gordonia defluvii]